MTTVKLEKQVFDDSQNVFHFLAAEKAKSWVVFAAVNS